jgi:hypothetical protein
MLLLAVAQLTALCFKMISCVNISDARRASFKVVRSNGHDEVLARAMNLLIARGAYQAAAKMYPEDLIELRQGARVIEKSK